MLPCRGRNAKHFTTMKHFCLALCLLAGLFTAPRCDAENTNTNFRGLPGLIYDVEDWDHATRLADQPGLRDPLAALDDRGQRQTIRRCIADNAHDQSRPRHA